MLSNNDHIKYPITLTPSLLKKGVRNNYISEILGQGGRRNLCFYKERALTGSLYEDNKDGDQDSRFFSYRQGIPPSEFWDH